MSIILPALTKLKLSGFDRLFRENELVVQIGSDLSILLGGNGLGKTTMLQAIIYGVAGELDKEIEPIKARRWGAEYFRGRMSSTNFASARIEVEFLLGDVAFRVERGLARSKVTNAAVGRNGEAWKVYNETAADMQYQLSVCECGNFESFSDFRYLVHRLVYLAEDRRGIMWDLDAQARILMLLNDDLLDERMFREGRNRLVLLDSRKRHNRVRMNDIKEQLAQAPVRITQVGQATTDASDELTKLVHDLRGTVAERQRLEQLEADAQKLVARHRQNVFTLYEHQRQIESNILTGTLQSALADSAIYWHTLLQYGTCPSCGAHNDHLRHLAQERMSHHDCPLCGTPVAQHVTPNVEEDVEAIQSQIAEKLRSAEVAAMRIADVQYDLESIRRTETQLRTDFELRRTDIGGAPSTRGLSPMRMSGEQLVAELRALELDQQSLTQSEEQLRTRLEGEYEQYITVAGPRLERLRGLFGRLATAFLGAEASLESTLDRDDRGLLSLFVPKFGGDIRKAPEDCSEAQRFFLDIAFRMAVLQLTSEMSDSENSFVCETPESALDISYMENAARMFSEFVRLQHGLVASTNVQEHGLAFHLIQWAKAESLDIHVFDLLSHGYPSTVQSESHRLAEVKNTLMELTQ